ncbi:MAG: hypothetical protein Q9194_003360 [Teloschistes cf. exilis]
MAPRQTFWASSDSSDDDTVSLTSTVLSEPLGVYELDAIVAEKRWDGVLMYLVKWKDYPYSRCTWEVKEQFGDKETLKDWDERKMRVTRGLAEAFDLDTWEREMEKVRADTDKRKALRRRKRIDLGIPVEDLPETDQSFPFEDSTDDDTSDASEEPVKPIWTAKEESILLDALRRLKAPRWREILKLYGAEGIVNRELKDKTETEMREKTIALKQAFDASGREFPVTNLTETSSDQFPDGKTGHNTVGSEKSSLKPRTASEKVGQNATARYSTELQTTEDTFRDKRKPDDQIAPNRTKPKRPPITIPSRRLSHAEPERPPITLPPRRLSHAEPKSAVTVPKGLVREKQTKPVASASPREPTRQNAIPKPDTRPSQFGIKGRGPARPGRPVTKAVPPQPINVLGNWSAEPIKRRKSRYEMRTAQDGANKPSGTFKKHSTRRKFELAGRDWEHTPDINSLTFLNRKDGKVLPVMPASVVPKKAEKTPFQVLQQRLSEEQKESAAASGVERSKSTPSSPTKKNDRGAKPPAVQKESNQKAEAVKTPAEANAPSMRASLPFETYAQRRPLHGAKPFAAPVAVMGPGQAATSLQTTIFPLQDTKPQPITDDLVDSPSELTSASPIIDRPAMRATKSSVDKQTTFDNPVLQRRKSAASPPLHHFESRPKPISSDLTLPKTQLIPSSAHDFQGSDGYALYPLDTYPVLEKPHTKLRNLDVIAEILTGSEGDSTGTVIFRGLRDFSLKTLFLTIRVPPRQMHVWCKTMVTAGEFATFFHDPPGYLGSGWTIAGRQSSSEQLEDLSDLLAQYASGGLFFAERFSILIYPANCAVWKFLDSGFPTAPPESRLRFAMFAPWPQLLQDIKRSPSRSENLHCPPSVQGTSINAVFRHQFGMDFDRLVAQSGDDNGNKTRLTNAFFTMFPPAAQEEFELVVRWIRSNRSSAIIFRWEDPGAWDHFQKSPNKSYDNAVIICHESFYDYWAIPNLALCLRRFINMFNLSLEPMSPLGPDPHLIRLFPAGQVILLTDSLFLLRPVQAARILAWFRLFVLPTKFCGTWKICTRPAICEWLMRIQEALEYPNGKDYVMCWVEVMRLLPRDRMKEWDPNTPTETAPIACMGTMVSNFDQAVGTEVTNISQVDEQKLIGNDVTLISWFAGWAMTKQEKFRRFAAVTGREEEDQQQQHLKQQTMRKYNHLWITNSEKFTTSQEVWDWAKIHKKDEDRLLESRKKDEGRAKEDEKSEEQGQQLAFRMTGRDDVNMEHDPGTSEGQQVVPSTSTGEDVEMRDVQEPAEESLFLPMDIGSSS